MRTSKASQTTMSQFDEELSLDQIDALMAIPQTRPRTRTKDEERNVKTWFKVTHVTAKERPCEVTLHDEQRPRNKGMTTLINDVAVCRVCYLAELDKGT